MRPLCLAPTGSVALGGDWISFLDARMVLVRPTRPVPELLSCLCGLVARVAPCGAKGPGIPSRGKARNRLSFSMVALVMSAEFFACACAAAPTLLCATAGRSPTVPTPFTCLSLPSLGSSSVPPPLSCTCNRPVTCTRTPPWPPPHAAPPSFSSQPELWGKAAGRLPECAPAVFTASWASPTRLLALSLVGLLGKARRFLGGTPRTTPRSNTMLASFWPTCRSWTEGTTSASLVLTADPGVAVST